MNTDRHGAGRPQPKFRPGKRTLPAYSATPLPRGPAAWDAARRTRENSVRPGKDFRSSSTKGPDRFPYDCFFSILTGGHCNDSRNTYITWYDMIVVLRSVSVNSL